jgi:flagellar hook-associated protein 2
MGTIRSGVGLISGINNAELVNSLISLQRAPVARLENRVAGHQATEAALKTLEATLVAITTSIQQLATKSTFNSVQTTLSDSSQVAVTAGETAIPGTYYFQSIRNSSTFSALSKGYANSDQQTVGAGTLIVSNGGELHQSTLLDALNSGNGIGRGVIRITDRSGNTADVDLANAYTLDDVLAAINSEDAISVVAGTADGRLVLTDTSGATLSDLSVVDLNGGHAAEDLGIAKSVAAATLDGDSVFTVTADLTLDQITEGVGLHLLNGAPDIRITLTDDTVIEVNLDNAATLNDILDAINNHADNGGKLSAALVDEKFVLTDLSAGGGSSTFAIEDINGSAAVRRLGLDVSAAGSVISGRRFVAGLNSILLGDLRGGTGIDQIGEISLTDRAGVSATVDLTAAESLDEVINAINSAVSGGGTKLNLTARVNDLGNGLVVEDTSGSTASNLIIADVGASTLATQLGIAVDGAQDWVDSGRLDLRYVTETTSIENYAPGGGDIQPGSIRIVDSAGNEAVIEISDAVKSIGDVLYRINLASGISVSAELNETGDGFVVIDEAGGSSPLIIEEVGSSTAADLRLDGTAVLGSDGKYRISSRFAAIVEIDADDTLDDVALKLNSAADFVTASAIDDGSAFNSFRLSLSATTSGSGGRLIIDDGGLGLGIFTATAGEDALLRAGSSVESGFLIASATNSFPGAAKGIDVDLLATGGEPVQVTVSRDTQVIEDAIQSFVDSYNTFVSTTEDLTAFDLETNRRGILQGRGIVLRAQGRLQSLVHRRLFGSGSPVRSLVDLGVGFNSDGELTFDKTRLASALDDDIQAVTDFFLEDDGGFADVAQAAIDSLTDPFTGAFTLENNALQASIKQLTDRIEQLDAILEIKRERLLREFINLESILGTLSSQQQALGGIAPISSLSTGIG